MAFFSGRTLRGNKIEFLSNENSLASCLATFTQFYFCLFYGASGIKELTLHFLLPVDTLMNTPEARPFIPKNIWLFSKDKFRSLAARQRRGIPQWEIVPSDCELTLEF